jgi:hypothetical protein
MVASQQNYKTLMIYGRFSEGLEHSTFGNAWNAYFKIRSLLIFYLNFSAAVKIPKLVFWVAMVCGLVSKYHYLK